jgi:hypothetical protein
MAKLQPDPGPAQPGQTVLLDGATYNAIHRMLAGVRGADDQIDVEEAADGATVLSLANEKTAYIIVDGAAVQYTIAMRPA